MSEPSGREFHVVKKALAIAVASVEQMPETPFRSDLNMADMKTLLTRMIDSNVALEQYARAARIAVTGKPD